MTGILRDRYGPPQGRDRLALGARAMHCLGVRGCSVAAPCSARRRALARISHLARVSANGAGASCDGWCRRRVAEPGASRLSPAPGSCPGRLRAACNADCCRRGCRLPLALASVGTAANGARRVARRIPRPRPARRAASRARRARGSTALPLRRRGCPGCRRGESSEGFRAGLTSSRRSFLVFTPLIGTLNTVHE
jgi:hypothetical protein